MTKGDFIEFAKRLCIYFERKPISMETLNEWFDEIQNIPSEPLPWIAKRIKENESFPRNIPLIVKSHWEQWLTSNPDKNVFNKNYGCDKCKNGYLYVSKWDESLNRWYNITYRCAYCRPPYPQNMALSTIEYLETDGARQPIPYITANGYADSLLIPDNKPDKSNQVKRGPVNSIIKNICDEMELPF